ncbi:MAG: hypothetical protein IJ544_00975 [Prevotella sp.]|nr:hypothetical protein [Prevotella sp.]
MANKRTLKHSINAVCDELFTEAVAASLYGNDWNQGNTEALLYSIVRTQIDFVCRVSHPEPGMKPHLYYKDLREQFSARVSEIIDQINNL